MPKSFPEFARTLLAHGLADPRTLEYRHVDLIADNDGGGTRVAKTRGWVLPLPAGARPDAKRFAVAWNGLVYPAVAVGAPADMAADVTAACDRDEKAQAEIRKGAPGSYDRERRGMSEHDSVLPDTVLAIRAVLLLRLGEPRLAERVWATWSAGASLPAQPDELARAVLFAVGTDLWARFDRAVRAHGRADDAVALADCRALGTAGPALEAEARRLKPKPPEDARPEDDEPTFSFLGIAPRLLADQERRAAEPPRRPAAAAGPAAFPSRAAYVDALVADLDDSSPGSYHALDAEGDAAVEPLIKCLETDQRLTRSVTISNRFSHRDVGTVRETAFDWLQTILGEHFDDKILQRAEAFPDDELVATEIREHWAKFKGVSRVERSYKVLADDDEAPDGWARAAAYLCEPADAPDAPIGRYDLGPPSVLGTHDRPGVKPRARRGDALRDGKNPSVSELFVKRLAQAQAAANARDARDANDRVGDSAHRAANALAACLLVWDGRSHLDLLRDHTAYLLDKRQAGAFGQRPGALGQAVGMFVARARIGDERALAEYAVWARAVTPEQVDGGEEYLFQPIWQFPADPAVAALAEDLFNGGRSPWNPLLQKRPGGRWTETRVLTGPMLGVPAFRKQVLRMLADRAVVGSMTIADAGQAKVTGGLGTYAGQRYNVADPLVPPVGTTVEFRACDVYALHLSAADGMPRVELHWPAEKRDAAVARCAELLARYGDRYLDARYVGSPAAMTFPALGRPATPDDVNAGRAIFSLLGDGPAADVRLVRLAGAPPLRARWTALKDHPYTSDETGPDGATRKVTHYRNDGNVWQAEEVLENGRWRRYFGFVGSHAVARVAAEEIEIEGFGNAAPLSGGIGVEVYPPGTDEDGRRFHEAVPAGRPLVAIAFLQNRSGFEKVVPATYHDVGPDRNTRLRAGVRLRLFYSADPGDDAVTWTELPGKVRPPMSGDPALRTLAVGERFTAFRVDLREWFDVPTTGRFEVQVTFDERAGAPATGESWRQPFQVVEP